MLWHRGPATKPYSLPYLSRTVLFGISLSLFIAGCGGGGNGTGTSVVSGNTVENNYGDFTTRAVGTAQEPVVSTSANSAVTGIAGASFTGIIQNTSIASRTLNNTRIAYSVFNGTNLQLATLPYGGTAPTKLTSGSRENRFPVWSPDGSKIVYQAVDANGYIQLAVMPSGGGTATQITTGNSHHYSPSWSPDGTKIAYFAWDTLNFYQIYVMSASGGSPVQITTGNFDHVMPVWSPDGNKIAYEVKDANGGLQIAIMSSVGGNSTSITSGSLLHIDPAWSPDSTSIAYSGWDSNGHFQIYTMSASGGTPTAITSGTNDHSHPVWSPDGLKIAYSTADANGLSQIFTIGASGGQPSQVTFGPNSALDPAWSPYLNAPITLIGTNGLLGTGAAGFIFSHDGNSIRSVVAFDTGTGTVASRATAHVSNLTPASAVSPTLLFSITASDSLSKLSYSNYDSTGRPQTAVNVALATGTTGALVAFNATTSAVATVLPYAATKSVGNTAQIHREGNTLVINGAFSGAYDVTGNDQNLQTVVHTVRLDASTGKLLSTN